MPFLSLFRGIRITMAYEEQIPPYVFAEYAGHRARVDILRGCVTGGSLPNRQLRLALAWIELHRDELMQDWELAKDEREPIPIEGLSSESLAMDYFPQVVQAVAGEDHTVYAYFSDGSVRKADVGSLVERGGAYCARLADRSFFTDRLTVLNEAVAWDVTGDLDETRCIDLDPRELYRNSPVVDDPLETEA